MRAWPWDWNFWEGGGGSRDTGLVTVDNLFENPARCMYVCMYVCICMYFCVYACIKNAMAVTRHGKFVKLMKS